MSFPDIFADFLAPGKTCGREAEEPHAGILGIVDAFDQFFPRQTVHDLGHTALGDIQLLRYALYGQIPFPPEKEEAPEFSLRDAELSGQERRLHLAALQHFLDQPLQSTGLVGKQFISVCGGQFVHSDKRL